MMAEYEFEFKEDMDYWVGHKANLIKIGDLYRYHSFYGWGYYLNTIPYYDP